MTRFIKRIILPLIFSSTINASDLCNTSCEATITFPDGGYIEASESIVITFGAGGSIYLGEAGTINTAIQPASIDFSNGGTLELATGESITFDVGGSLHLGDGGNLNYSNIAINTTSALEINAIGESSEININQIHSENNISITTNSDTININNASITTGAITISSADSNIVMNPELDAVVITDYPYSCPVSAGTTLEYDHLTGVPNSLCIEYDFEPPILTASVLISRPGFEIDLDSATIETVWELLVSGDLLSCEIISDDRCVLENGKEYKLVDGEWLPADSGGTTNLTTLLLLFLIPLIRRIS